MMKRPLNVVLACAISVIAGIVAIASFSYNFNPDSDSVLWATGLGLLITVLYFATAGLLYQNGKGNYPSLIFLEFLNGIIIVVAIFVNCINVWFGLALIILTIITILLSIPKSTEHWIISDRA